MARSSAALALMAHALVQTMNLFGPAHANPQRGHDLFTGAAPLVGKIVGHARALPPQSVRCINCHAPGSAAPASVSASASASASAATNSFGPLLTRSHLTTAIERRGGPPSRYDAAAFCRLLRDGVDPAYVMIQRAMPRYTLTDADCRALWALLSSPERP
jgi:hypothetical protein